MVELTERGVCGSAKGSGAGSRQSRGCRRERQAGEKRADHRYGRGKAVGGGVGQLDLAHPAPADAPAATLTSPSFSKEFDRLRCFCAEPAASDGAVEPSYSYHNPSIENCHQTRARNSAGDIYAFLIRAPSKEGDFQITA